MQQYFINNPLGDSIILEGDLFHYLNNVIRIRVDEKFILFNNEQKAIYIVSSIDSNNKMISCQLEQYLEVKKDKYQLDLAFGLLKKDKNDLVIQKATELGINNILLLKLTNNIMKISKDKENKKLKRYEDFVISASEQSKRDFLPSISYVPNKDDIVYSDYDYVFFLYEKSEDNNFSKVLFSLEKYEGSKMLLIVGPEGGFTDQEIYYFKERSTTVFINDNILRAETASIVAVGLVKNLLS